jgi:HSP20 family protein
MNLQIFRRPFDLVSQRDNVFSAFENQFHKHFNNMLEDWNPVKSAESYPKIDIYQDNGYLHIDAAISGLTEDDINIDLNEEQNILRISGQHSAKKENKDSNFFIKELTYRKFSRDISYDRTQLEGDPEAEVKNGMLHIKWKIKKAEEQKPQVKKINFKKS